MQFLSNEWFTKVSELRAASNVEVPDQLKNSVINVTLTDKDDNDKLHIKGGEFVQGHNDDAGVTLSLSSELLRKVFLEMDSTAGMQAFFAGEIKVDGDVSKLMELQSYQPGEDEKKLIDDIIAITD